MLAKRFITARPFASSPNKKARNFWQLYYQNYSIAGFKPMDQTLLAPKPSMKISTVALGARKFHDNSHFNTCNHEYYQKYSIPGFDPVVYSLPTQPIPVENVPTVNIEEKKVLVEDNSHITTCCHEYYQKYSIAGFKPINHVPTPIDVTKKGPASYIESQEEEDDNDDIDP